MFTLTIITDNDDFQPDPGYTTALLLKRIAAELKDGQTFGSVRDGNGNRVGAWSLT